VSFSRWGKEGNGIKRKGGELEKVGKSLPSEVPCPRKKRIPPLAHHLWKGGKREAPFPALSFPGGVRGGASVSMRKKKKKPWFRGEKRKKGWWGRKVHVYRTEDSLRGERDSQERQGATPREINMSAGGTGSPADQR